MHLELLRPARSFLPGELSIDRQLLPVTKQRIIERERRTRATPANSEALLCDECGEPTGLGAGGEASSLRRYLSFDVEIGLPRFARSLRVICDRS